MGRRLAFGRQDTTWHVGRGGGGGGAPLRRASHPAPRFAMFRALQDIEHRYLRVVDDNRRLYNTVQDLRGAIRVFCRIRPPGATGAGSMGSCMAAEPHAWARWRTGAAACMVAPHQGLGCCLCPAAGDTSPACVDVGLEGDLAVYDARCGGERKLFKVRRPACRRCWSSPHRRSVVRAARRCWRQLVGVCGAWPGRQPPASVPPPPPRRWTASLTHEPPRWTCMRRRSPSSAQSWTVGCRCCCRAQQLCWNAACRATLAARAARHAPSCTVLAPPPVHIQVRGKLESWHTGACMSWLQATTCASLRTARRAAARPTP